MHIFRPKNDEGNWITDGSEISNTTIHAFQSQLNGDHCLEAESLLDNIPHLISHEQNDMLSKFPSIEELQKVIKATNSDSVAGPDGFNDFFIIYVGILLRMIYLLLFL